MSVWDSLKVVIVRLRDEQPGSLTSFPDPRHDTERRPPFRIGLAAWATDAAQELHSRFGDDVALTVGSLPYPSGAARPRPAESAEPTVDPGLLRIEPSAPLSVRSGHTARAELTLTNRGESQLTVSSNGALTAVVLDPADGRVVGGFSGAQTMRLVTAFVPAGGTTTVPLLIGTASVDPALGYAVPPGDWAVRAPIVVSGQRLTTPVFPLTITD